MENKNKSFTIIIMPEGVKGKYRTIELSKKTIKIMVSALGVFVFIFLFIIIDYFNVKSTAILVKKLENENKTQAQKIVMLEDTMKDLNAKLTKFEEYKRKLNIIAGLESPMSLTEIGQGDIPLQNSVPPTKNNINNSINPQKKITLNQPDKVELIKNKANKIEKNLDFLYNYFKEQQKILASTPSIWPTRGIITSTFNWRIDPFTGLREFHYGIDIATQLGNPVKATADGIIVESAFKKDFGNYVAILHSYGFKTIYAHLKKRLVRVGQKVKRGDSIGLVGSTGKSTAPHLHYEVRVHNKPVNPLDYILENDWIITKKQ
jgi:murein DD-endopeptidase MepM/ murein hydrolase activator NlpD